MRLPPPSPEAKWLEPKWLRMMVMMMMMMTMMMMLMLMMLMMMMMMIEETERRSVCCECLSQPEDGPTSGYALLARPRCTRWMPV